MGSGKNREDYEISYEKVIRSSKPERRLRVESTAYGVDSGTVRGEESKRDVNKVIKSASRIADKFTRPDPGAKAIWIIGVDNSGSNKIIAKHMKESSGYICGYLSMIAPQDQVAFVFFSDHCDGEHGLFQEVDFLYSDEKGDAIMCATLDRVSPAGGGDIPEAIECLFKKMAELDLPKSIQKNFVLITDAIAHGMGWSGDEGCPDQVSWSSQLQNLKTKFDNFFVIACGDDEKMEAKQRKFMQDDKNEDFNFISLINIKDSNQRKKITPTALLFLIARAQGLQNCELFLSALYEKWMVNVSEFGKDAPVKAREAILRFGNYLDMTEEAKTKFFKEVFAL